MQAPALSSTSGGTGPSILHLEVACDQPSKHLDVNKSSLPAFRSLSRDITDPSTWLLFLLSSFDLLCRTRETGNLAAILGILLGLVEPAARRKRVPSAQPILEGLNMRKITFLSCLSHWDFLSQPCTPLHGGFHEIQVRCCLVCSQTVTQGRARQNWSTCLVLFC